MPEDQKPGLVGEIKEKLIRSKQKWAQQGRLLTGRPDLGHVERLPPGQKLVTNWPVLDLGVQPDIKPENWRLRIDGLVEQPLAFNLQQFLALPQQEFTSDIHCVTSWSRYDNRWRGVSSKTILDLVKPKGDARHVIFHAYDGYTTNVKCAVFAEDNVLLAFLEERQVGQPHRVPCRRQARFLGSPRIPQRGRSVEGRALQLNQKSERLGENLIDFRFQISGIAASLASFTTASNIDAVSTPVFVL
jgi:DMSO/TMAO reductase YedYZ molybdopterin-dependent catalytic subunit